MIIQLFEKIKSKNIFFSNLIFLRIIIRILKNKIN
jgi:hypothetical protein